MNKDNSFLSTKIVGAQEPLMGEINRKVKKVSRRILTNLNTSHLKCCFGIKAWFLPCFHGQEEKMYVLWCKVDDDILVWFEWTGLF